MQVIRWFDLPKWEQNVVLDGNVYYISVNYNTRDNAWYISIRTNEDIPLITGKKVTLNTDILENVYSILKPNGILYVSPIGNDVKEITRDNMGVEVEMVFISNDELL